MKILVIAGHGAGDCGATAKVNGKTYKEADEARSLAKYVIAGLKKIGCEVSQYPQERNAYKDCQSGTYKVIGKPNMYNLVLELHFNACSLDLGNGKTKGVEVYVPTSATGIAPAEKICANIAACGLTSRGVKKKNYTVIQTSKSAGAYSMLVETCFIDDADDMKVYAAKQTQIAQGIVDAIADAYGLKKKKAELQQFGAYFNNIAHIGYYPMTGTKGEIVSAAAKRIKWNDRYCDAICNAELFDMTTYAPVSGVVSGGVDVKLTDTFGISFVNNIKPTFSYKNNVKAPDWISAYPMLVRDGKKAYANIPSGLGGEKARTALCMNDNVFAICYVPATMPCTLDDFTDLIIERGFKTAINLDGGGSTACVTPYVSYDQGRKVRGFIAMWMKDGKGNKLTK